MHEQTKSMAVALSGEQEKKLETIENQTGKNKSTILKECVENGLKQYLLGRRRLFWVKARIDERKLNQFGRLLQSGMLDTSMIKLTYCIKDDPTVGISLWEVENRKELKTRMEPHKKFYRDILEISEAILPEEAMERIITRS
jgi:hypothetical protein